MSGKYFLDTNIIVYSFDSSQPGKMEKAQELIADSLSSHKGIISFQVIQEFLNVATGKFKKSLTIVDSQKYVDEVLLPLCDVFPGNDFYKDSLEIKDRTGYSFYDCMIIQAALQANCRILYSEDMQDGFKFFDMTIQNPFR